MIRLASNSAGAEGLFRSIDAMINALSTDGNVKADRMGNSLLNIDAK